MRVRERWSRHWPEYLIEGAALAAFMISAGVFTMLVEHPASPLADSGSALARRSLVGFAMGATAIVLITSPWGRRSGAHMNPAVTLAYLALGKIARADALAYIAAQFVGGASGLLLLWSLAGATLAAPPINFVMTVPGSGGIAIAFIAEFGISCLMMATVLLVSNHARLAPWTPYVAGSLVALFIAFEAPLSGMSMNPARSFASSLPAWAWHDYWIYLIAPVLGMSSAAHVYRWLAGAHAAHCAKLVHASDQRCIHCGYVPATP